MILKVKGLSKSFVQGEHQVKALKSLNFDMDANQSLAIVGPSGSGKTTLLSLLAGLDTATEGEIWMKESPIHQMSERQLGEFRSENIGIVFQQFHLMPHLTALENVMLPLEILNSDQAKQKAQEALKQVGLFERMNHRPDQLSGGECQRVAIARAFVVKPTFLLADEPSGNLDTETGQKVMDLLFQLAEEYKMTLILITHDLNLAQRCQRQIQLVGGQMQ